MRVSLFNMISKGRLAWLLGMLLLMPLAQTAANWHLIAHAHAQATQSADDPSAGIADYCDLCQTASATSAGLLPTVLHASQAVAPPTTLTPLSATAAPNHAAWPSYASRAPPFALS